MGKSVVLSHRRGGYAEASSLLIIAVIIFVLVLSGPSTVIKERDELSNNNTLDLCPQAEIDECLNGDLPALSDKQSTLSMCLKARKVGQLIQALSITEDLACVGEDQQVLRGYRTYIWPGHFSDENVLLNSAKTGNAKNNNLFTVCSYFARERERKTSQYNVNWSSNYAKTFLPNPLNMIYRLYLHMTRQVIKGLVNLEHKVISLYKVVLFNSLFFPFFFFSNLALLTSLTGMIFFFN